MITYFKGYLPHSYLAHLVVVRINESICAKLLQQCLGVCVCAPSHPYMRVHVHISHLTNANYLYICLYSWLLLASRTNWLDLMEGKHEPTPLPSCHRFQRRHTKSSFKRIFFHSLYYLLLLLFTGSVKSDSLWSNGLQQVRLIYPSPSPGACSNSGPLSWWCHPAISSSVIPFSSCLQSFLASGSFLMSKLFTSVGQSFGASPSASILLGNIQVWFPLGLTGFISLQS